MITEQVACRRCGECCLAGGPALHRADYALVQRGIIPLINLITIRKGEPVYNPLHGTLQVASVELVKLMGKGSEWTCGYFEVVNGCTLYADRPLACRILKCWDTEAILAVVEKDTLCRADILSVGDALLAVIEEHEQLCPYDDLLYFLPGAIDFPDDLQMNMERFVQLDLSFRQGAVARHHLNLREELFYFGRPLFQLLQQFGLQVVEKNHRIQLNWSRWPS